MLESSEEPKVKTEFLGRDPTYPGIHFKPGMHSSSKETGHNT